MYTVGGHGDRQVCQRRQRRIGTGNPLALAEQRADCLDVAAQRDLDSRMGAGRVDDKYAATRLPAQAADHMHSARGLRRTAQTNRLDADESGVWFDDVNQPAP